MTGRRLYTNKRLGMCPQITQIAQTRKGETEEAPKDESFDLQGLAADVQEQAFLLFPICEICVICGQYLFNILRFSFVPFV